MTTRSILAILTISIVVLLTISVLLYWRSYGLPFFEDEIDYVTVGLVPEDGVTIAGRYYPSPGKIENRGVILLHALDGSQADWKKFVKILHEQNFEVMTLDFRGHGESSGKWKKFSDKDFAKFVDDAAEAVHYLRDINGEMKIAVVGASIGANVALQLADRTEAVTAVVLLSPSTNYHGIKIAAINKQFTRPVLYVTSQTDPQSAEPTQQLYDASPSAEKKLKTYAQTGHGTKLLNTTRALRVYMVTWLNQYLGYE